MTGKLDELVKRHNLVRIKLEKLLATEDDLTRESITELDQSLEALFQNIMMIELSDDAEKLTRIRFAIAEIAAICENSILAKTLTDRIFDDARDLTGSQHASDRSLADDALKSSP